MDNQFIGTNNSLKKDNKTSVSRDCPCNESADDRDSVISLGSRPFEGGENRKTKVVLAYFMYTVWRPVGRDIL